MKLKSLFALFNAVLILSFLALFLMPLFLLGGDYFGLFWGKNWSVALLFALTLAAINAYFLANWKIFSLLEREEWKPLIALLEKRTADGRILHSLHVRILLNSYLVTSRTDDITKLESVVRGRRPALLDRYSVQFAVPYLLMGDPVRSEAFFLAMAARPRVRNRGWMRWSHAFALMQVERRGEAVEELKEIHASAKDPILALLCLYLLEAYGKSDGGVADAVQEGADRLRRTLDEPSMRRRIERSAENTQILILSRILADAVRWLYHAGEAASA